MPQISSTPRIDPVQPPYEGDIAEQLAKWMPPGAPVEPLVLFRTLVVHPELASRMRPLGSALLAHGLLEPRDREIVVLRTCARAGAEYEWGVHAVAFAASAGLEDDQVAATVAGHGDDPVWSAREGLLIRLVDELHETNTISAEAWAELADEFSSSQLLELIVTAGWYRTLSYVVNAIGIEHERWAARFPPSPADAQA
jgi:4-carboxymuconolactone decarboxylase